MMEFDLSPRNTPPGPHRMLSPPHVHGPHIDAFPSIKQIRQSLSRSPSKPQRFAIYTARPILSSATSEPTSPSLGSRTNANSNLTETPRPKYSVKRANASRTSLRRPSPNSPLRRALSDTTNQVNITSRTPPRISPHSNRDTKENKKETTPEPQDRICDEPIKINFLKADKLLQPVLKEHASPMKSSPLKRSDGVMNLEAATTGSPRNKRRSLHGVAMTGDFNVFDYAFESSQPGSSEMLGHTEKEPSGFTSSTWPGSVLQSPQKRPFSLRKSTLQQRATPSRTRLFQDVSRDAFVAPALTRAKSRISLDSALPLRSVDMDSPFQRSNMNETHVFTPPAAQRPYQSAPKPHPLSHALTPSSSASSVTDEGLQAAKPPLSSDFANLETSKPVPGFSKSLPIGTVRQTRTEQVATNESFATPDGYKMAKPLPQAFMSTGLISKRNRNVDLGSESLYGAAHMPDTPSKKAAHVLIAPTPAPPSALGKIAPPMHEFGTPSTPFNARLSRASPHVFGKSANIFGVKSEATSISRRSSFISVDGDDINHSPTVGLDSTSNPEELPPTPTKSTSVSHGRPHSKGKNNSLRSSIFGRRTSIGPDTFTDHAEGIVIDDEFQEPTGVSDGGHVEHSSPHTPQDSFCPPDPSNLSISAEFRPPTAFRSTIGIFPPATPTGPRESFGHSLGQTLASSGYFANDVDTSLTARFAQVTSTGVGEFSQVYRVERPHATEAAGTPFKGCLSGRVWAVKKSRRPYTGNKDRQRKMREVRILRALRGHEHVIELVDDWESKGHLYIQMEFCENGNLKDFLSSTGFKGRLDDFRIWKILLELSQGVRSIHEANFIHLDLKPANVFIDWEGVLKIGDFGMASSWPAPPGLDGEGDREYIGPEVLSGRFDKPADIFALGMIMLEIAGNIVLPDNGTSWQRLRAGDMSDLPSLTWSSESSLVRDESGEPVELMLANGAPGFSSIISTDDDDLSFLKPHVAARMVATPNLVDPPNFMVDPQDPEALDRVVQRMIQPDPDQRPTVHQLLGAGGVAWVERRRRAGATVFEGNWGPADDVLNHSQDVEMADI